MTKDYSPWDHVRQMPEVLVAYDQLDYADAYWEPEHRVILLDSRLGQAERRCRLAHELAHVERGDECLTHGPDADRLARRQERSADEIAARRLISLDQLADVLCWAWHTGEIAEALHVDEDTVCVRILTLTDPEKDLISARVAARGDVA